MADEKTANELLEHQLGTYSTLRVVLFWIGIALPIVVAVVGWLQCANPPQWIAGSLSAYYHRTAIAEFLTARDLFVGGLLAAATCLYAYKGFSTRENVALNLAAVFAVGVALLPTSHGGLGGNESEALKSCVVFVRLGYEEASIRPMLHAASAIAFFLCLAYVSIRRSRDTLRLVPNEERREWYNRGYFAAGTAMVVLPATAVLVSQFAKTDHPKVIFFVEAFGVWAFSGYWWLKSREMRETQADARVAKQQVKRATVAAKPPAKTLDRVVRQVQVGRADSVERIVPVDR